MKYSCQSKCHLAVTSAVAVTLNKVLDCFIVTRLLGFGTPQGDQIFDTKF